MNTNRLPIQLQSYFDTFIDGARERDFPPDILDALQGLSELPNHLSIDLKGILRQAAIEGAKNRSLPQELLEFLRRFFRDGIHREMESALAHVGTDPFLYANTETLGTFLDELLSRIELAINRLKTSTVGYREEAEQIHQRLVQQEQAYFKLQEECGIRFSHTIRDYQMALARLGVAPAGETEQQIKSILESGLDDMGITVLWEQPEDDVGQYFVAQNDSRAKSGYVSRPCLVQGVKVIHQGVLVTPPQ